MNILKDEFTYRLRNRDVEKDYEEIMQLKNYLCELRLELTKNNSYVSWSMDDIDKVLNNLKLNKAKDPHGHVNEMYKNFGNDGKLSLLIMMNNIKQVLVLPTKMEDSDVTTLYKGKGSKQDVINMRGIFQLPIVRNILDRLIYGDEYENVSQNMGCFQVGSKKGRNIRDHTLVLHAIINEARTMKLNIDVNLYDIEQCFDSIWLQEALNDLYNSGVNSRNLNILFNGNSKTRMLVKTRLGNTDRVMLENLVMQGSVPGPILCSNQLSKLSNKMFKEGSVYMYLKKIPVPALIMVDDIATIQTCGSIESMDLNIKCESFVKSKKLKFQVEKGKCQYVHIGNDKCKSKYFANNYKIFEEKSAKYLGDYISNDTDVLYEKRAQKAMGYVSTCIAMTSEISLGYRLYDIAKLLLQTIFLNGTLINMETWTNFNQKRVDVFEKIEQHFLRKILKAHSKTAIESLYLELGIIPFRYHLMKRRILFYYTIMKRNYDELTKKVVNAQKFAKLKGDFYTQVVGDMDKLNVSEDDVVNSNKNDFKELIKMKIKNEAFNMLIEKAKTHSKVRSDLYMNMEGSSYFFDSRFHPGLSNTLFMLRTRMYNVKNNFRNNYIGDMLCPLCTNEPDTQDHLFECEMLIMNNTIDCNYEDIFSNNNDVLFKVATTAKELINTRRLLLDP